MRRKLTMAIMSLVIAASLLTTATFAWFQISTEVTVDSMDMVVGAQGSLSIRNHNYTILNLEDNPAGYGTTVDPEDVKNTIEPVAPKYSFPGETAGEFFTETEVNKLGGSDAINPKTNLSGVDRLYRAKSLQDYTKGVVFAEEQVHYGKWGVDILSSDEDAVLTAEAQLVINGGYDARGAITKAQVILDYIRAYTIEIVEFTKSQGTAENSPIIVEEKPNVVATGRVVAPLGDDDAIVSVDDIIADSEKISDTEQKWIDHITPMIGAEGGISFDIEFTYLVSDTGVDADNMGVFTQDTPRSFGIYYYIDGNADVVHHAVNGSQNHITRVDTGTVITFKSVVAAE